MKITKILIKVALLIGSLCLAPFASAKVIADFHMDFQASNPNGGWTYEWNPTGIDINNQSGYSKLLPYKKGLKMIVDLENRPGKRCTLPNATRLQISFGRMSSGNPASNSDDDIDHYAIAAYTIQPGEEGEGRIINSSIQCLNRKRSGTISLYINDRLLGSDKVESMEPSSFDIPLGYLNVGDTVYFALGPGESASVGVDVQFQIDTEK